MKASHTLPTISRIDTAEALECHLQSLCNLLQSCINDDPPGSSIGFLAPLSDAAAAEYWRSLSEIISGPSPQTVLLIATKDDQLVATGQVSRSPKETHNYRGEIRKLLVSTSTRGSGVGRMMMNELEAISRDELALDTLALDTATATPARGFYQRLGWTEWGLFPEYAKSADGTRHDCSFFYKKLAG